MAQIIQEQEQQEGAGIGILGFALGVWVLVGLPGNSAKTEDLRPKAKSQSPFPGTLW